MDQGKTSVARSLLELQPTALLEFFVIYPNYVDKPETKKYFHGGSVFSQKVKWQGKTYEPVPIEVEGFEVTTNGQLPRPKIRFSNKEYLLTNILAKNDDFRHARIIRKRTFVKYLDADNFSDNENPWGTADPTAEISNEIYTVGQKVIENKVFVEFELTSPLDVDNQDVTRRILMSQYCPWRYRGAGCGYASYPKADSDDALMTYSGSWDTDKDDDDFRWEDTDTTANGYNPTGTAYASGVWRYMVNKNITITNPTNGDKTNLKTWYKARKDVLNKNNFTPPNDNDDYWQREDCSKTVNGCKIRFGSTADLPFGGFPGTNKYGN